MMEKGGDVEKERGWSELVIILGCLFLFAWFVISALRFLGLNFLFTPFTTIGFILGALHELVALVGIVLIILGGTAWVIARVIARVGK